MKRRSRLRSALHWLLILAVSSSMADMHGIREGGVQRDYSFPFFDCSFSNTDRWSFTNDTVVEGPLPVNVDVTSDGYLTIGHVNPYHEGIYKCTYDGGSHLFNLSVAGVPRFTGCPDSSSTCTGNHSIVKDQPLTINVSFNYYYGGKRGIKQNIRNLLLSCSGKSPSDIYCTQTMCYYNPSTTTWLSIPPYDSWNVPITFNTTRLSDTTTCFVKAVLLDPSRSGSHVISTITSTMSISLVSPSLSVKGTFTNTPMEYSTQQSLLSSLHITSTISTSQLTTDTTSTTTTTTITTSTSTPTNIPTATVSATTSIATTSDTFTTDELRFDDTLVTMVVIGTVFALCLLVFITILLISVMIIRRNRTICSTFSFTYDKNRTLDIKNDTQTISNHSESLYSFPRPIITLPVDGNSSFSNV